MTDAILKAITYINDARRIVAFTGAGISTEAGIPDFRSPGGLWEDEGLMEQLSAPGFRRDPAGFYRAALRLMPGIRGALPTSTHRLLVELEDEGRLAAIVTQNIDGLHQAAGSRNVLEIHGTFRTGRCVNCRRKYEMDDLYHGIAEGRTAVPLCENCGSVVKPDVVLFGDLLPEGIWNDTIREIVQCDLMLVLGSSLIVQPAAGLPRLAVEHGARVIIVNREPTALDHLATLVVHGPMNTFAEAVRAGRQQN